MCRLFGASKQAYYKRDEQRAIRKIAGEAFALEYIRSVRKLNAGIGARKLWFMYKAEFPDMDRIGRDAFEQLFDRHGLKVRQKKRRPRTTDSSHGLPLYPNLVYAFIPDGVNQLWVSDITYITIWPDNSSYTHCYLTLIMDAYSHEIKGWAVGDSLKTMHTSDALRMALDSVKDATEKLIHHSDRGVQYASKEYTDILKENHIAISMTENGDPKENAMAERINSTMKNELLKDMRFTCIEDVREAVAGAVSFYNTRRPHMSIAMMTPQQAATCSGEIDKKWKSYREEAIKAAIG